VMVDEVVFTFQLPSKSICLNVV